MILMRFVFATLSFGLIWTTRSSAQSYAIGADLSFLKMAEDQGFQFKEEGEVRPGLRIFQDHGYNWIRLR
jgi:arabinogalactan endo-1,4-beta-galactosidase